MYRLSIGYPSVIYRLSFGYLSVIYRLSIGYVSVILYDSLEEEGKHQRSKE